MLTILFTQEWILIWCNSLPVNSNSRVIPHKAALAFWVVEVDAFVGDSARLSFNNSDLHQSKAEDFVVEFEKKEPLTAVCCTPDCYLLTEENKNTIVTKLYGEKEPGIIPVTSTGFGNGHLFTNITSNWVGLRNRIDGSIIKIQTKEFPYCMIWQNTKGSPQFVCIEPWHGLPDAENCDHIWDNKIGMNELVPGEEFVCEQNIWAE